VSKFELAVIIATKGRPALVADLVDRLSMQTRPADHIFAVGAEPADIGALDEDRAGLTAVVGRTGSSLQRNDAIALADDSFRYLVFFDDDFVPSRFWLERAIALFASAPDIAGVTGVVLADGVHSVGIETGDGVAIVDECDGEPIGEANFDESFGPYGCNMAFRSEAIQGMIFDERLPLYAWLEDADFGERVRKRGRMGRADTLFGVHLGNRTGRENGRRIGYSQIANATYLTRKGTLAFGFTAPLMMRNLASNLLRSFAPEPYIDRRARLTGNLMALFDILRGRIEPERAARL
jgi:GT2 family glycosyltransferase